MLKFWTNFKISEDCCFFHSIHVHVPGQLNRYETFHLVCSVCLMIIFNVGYLSISLCSMIKTAYLF